MKVESIFVLNIDCLLEIFKYLELEDSLNFAETCSQLRMISDQAFKTKFSKFTIDRKLMNGGMALMNRVLRYIGPHILSLTVDWAWQRNKNDILKKIQQSCVQLNCLILVHCEVSDFQSFDFMICVRMLTLNKCTLDRKKDILKHFLYLKCLHIYHCSGIRTSALRQCFQNNPEIENVAFIGYGFDVIKIIEPLTQLEHLTKLKLNCQMQNLNNFLFELASRDIIEELELFRIKIDNNTFNILNLFRNLRLLVVDQCSDLQELNSTLPLSLRHLQLKCFTISFNTFISIIRQLKRLENVDLYCCYCTTPDSESISFDDIIGLSEEVMKNLDFGLNQPTLSVTLPEAYAQCDTVLQVTNLFIRSYTKLISIFVVFRNFLMTHTI